MAVLALPWARFTVDYRITISLFIQKTPKQTVLVPIIYAKKWCAEQGLNHFHGIISITNLAFLICCGA